MSINSLDDQGRLRLMLSGLWLAFEKSYFAREYGLLGEAEWKKV